MRPTALPFVAPFALKTKPEQECRAHSQASWRPKEAESPSNV